MATYTTQRVNGGGRTFGTSSYAGPLLEEVAEQETRDLQKMGLPELEDYRAASASIAGLFSSN